MAQIMEYFYGPEKADLRQPTLGLKDGDEVLISLDDGVIHISTRKEQLRRAQDLIRSHVSASRSLADELIAERLKDTEGGPAGNRRQPWWVCSEQPLHLPRIDDLQPASLIG
jgi:hypothetical protein